MNDTQREGLYGKLFTFGEYKRGDSITFTLNGRVVTGPIDWITSPGPVYAGGPDRPIGYIVESVIDSSTDMAAVVHPYQIIH